MSKTLLGLVAVASCLMSYQDVIAQRGGFRDFGERRGRDVFGGEDAGPTERLDPEELEFADGVAAIPDHATFQKLSYKGEQHLDELRDRLARIHGRFRRLYGHSEDDQFAMEIEYKITKDGTLAIKQARPWVFSE